VSASRGWVWLGLGLLTAFAAVLAASRSLPAFFMAMAAAMALLALAALFHSLRVALGDRQGALGLRTALPERAALMDEKNVLLRAIKDIAYEREVGKLSEADHARLDRAYRLRAKEVLRKLDEDLAPYLAEAERLIAEPSPSAAMSAATPSKKRKKKGPKPAVAVGRACARCGTDNRADAAWCKACGAAVGERTCEACDAENEPDAKFCIKCAAPMGKAERTDAVPSEASSSEASSSEREPAETESGSASESEPQASQESA
jgi:hypothetical protein